MTPQCATLTHLFLPSLHHLPACKKFKGLSPPFVTYLREKKKQRKNLACQREACSGRPSLRRMSFSASTGSAASVTLLPTTKKSGCFSFSSSGVDIRT